MGIETIKIENCNNIKSCDFTIGNEMLNIKYAINGTGKSTISKAIKLSSDNERLNSLTPFAAVNHNDEEHKPKVSDLRFQNVVVFNDEYLKKCVYQKSELLENTFEIMIYSDRYYNLKTSIEEQLKDIKAIARDKNDVSKIKEIMSSLCNLLVVNGDNRTLSRRQSAIKSVFNNSKGALFNLPTELTEFKPFVDDANGVEWAAWKLNGINKFSEKGICPYCAGEHTENTKRKSQIFKDSFDENSINFSNKLREFLEEIGEYIDDKKLRLLLDSINSTFNRDELESELVKLSCEARYLFSKLHNLADFNGFTIDHKNMNEFQNKFQEMIIEETALDYFNTDLFLKEVRELNEQVKKVLDMIGQLKGQVAQFQNYLNQQIRLRKTDINNFLTSAGFNYEFDIIIEDENQAHAILKYKLEDGTVKDVSVPDRHLSWGEKNAFALLMFMYDAISKNADLIILDDPISSFDSNKKYAIINRLFKTGDKENSLYQRTVLLLTHDFEPVIDYVQVGGKQSSEYIRAEFLENINGIVYEKSIEKNVDMMSMVVLMKELACDSNMVMPVRIGCLRKFFEHTVKSPRENSLAYNVLSSLVHGREKPSIDNEGKDLMSETDVGKAEVEIKKYISDFNYDEILTDLSLEKLIDMFEQEQNDYCKLLILRAYIEQSEDARKRLKDSDDILRKFVDETYHIENDYVYSLDIRKFNIVPQYYIEAAKQFIENEKINFKK